MSREILFKAKRVNWKELQKEEWWAKGYLWAGNGYSYIIPCNVGISYDEKEKRIVAFAHEVISETVCQYTGLTDKNGRKIFEGDICVIYDDFCAGEEFIVKYDTDNGKYVLAGENATQDFNGIYGFYECEVISSIFEGGTK